MDLESITMSPYYIILMYYSKGPQVNQKFKE